MPKGDRFKLKADPEDGTTPISNLLLEAVAMSKLSGLQKGAILYLWRKTYGWIDNNGKRKKECDISLSEWVKALDSTKSSVATALTELEGKSVIIRKIKKAWGIYSYSINTEVGTWNSNCLNNELLLQTVQLPKTVLSIPPEQLPQTAPTVTQNRTVQLPKTVPPTLYKERLKKVLKKEGVILTKSTLGDNTKTVFGLLDKERGYRPTKRKAEAASIMRMLKTYTPEQIINTWKLLKQDKFWKSKELFMMTVESQIGAILINHSPSAHISEKYGGSVTK